jgi:hypothetical protein
MTPISELPKLPNGTVLPLLTGTIERLFEVKEGVTAKKKLWKKQSFVLRSPSSSVVVETFIQSLFVTDEDKGKEVTYYSTETGEGFKGVTKTSYEKDGETKTKITLEQGTKLKPTTATPKQAPIIMQPATPIPTSMQRSYSSDIEKLAKQWRCCWDAAVDHAPKDWTDVLRKDMATTLFIEGNRKGLKFAAPMNRDILPTQGESKPQEQSFQDKSEAELRDIGSKLISPPSPPKRSDESLATKILLGDHFTAEDLKGHNLERVFDLLYSEGKAECPVEFLDAEYDSVKKRSDGDEQKTYSRIICNWNKYLQAAKNRGIVEPEVE